MIKLAIVFRRTVNAGYGDQKDKKSSRGDLVKGTRGEHVEEWSCKMCDRFGWPFVSKSVEYIAAKVSQGAEPIRIEGEGAFPDSWSEEQRKRVNEVLTYVRPLVRANQKVAEIEALHEQRQTELADGQGTKSGGQAARTGKAKGTGTEALPTEG